MAKKRTSKLRLIPLGGLGEIGKNMLVVEYGRDTLVIDAGLMFPEEEMLGIDLVLPDYSYLKKNRERVRAIILTHGHEDHVGSLPYILKEVKVPLYGTRLTLGLVRGKLEEYDLTDVDLREISPKNSLQIGQFKLEFIRVCHSIPDGVGLAIHTPVGTIVHSGDFKLDQTPIDGRATQLDKFASLGERGVLALLSDSTNAETPGYIPSERIVGRALVDIFKQAKKRIIVASFASHIHRIQQVANVTFRSKRKLAISGLSMMNNIEIASKLGYLKIPDGLLINIREIDKYPPREVVVMSTGSQGEPLSALSKMASGEHKWIKIVPGDTVILSASPVPGNEKSVAQTIDRFFKRGANVFYETISPVHVSGHAAQEELKLMIGLVKPKYFIPIHGEYRHLKHHTDLAKEMGIPPENILLAENGSIIEFTDSSAQIKERVSVGTILVDGLGVGDIGDIVLRDRLLLSTDGIFIVIVAVSADTGEIVAGPDVVSRGFIYVREAGELIEEAKECVQSILEQCAERGVTDWTVLKTDVRNTLRKFLYDKTQRRPMIMPIIVEV
ncbi:MAG TPA: ribonuclease J [Actinobacteria bacterium]|nr:ribonuclease J [Actinomycetota bacterium]